MTTKIKLTDVRLSFPDLFNAVEYQKGDGKFRYNASFLIVPGSENDKAVNAAIALEANTVYEKKAGAMLESLRGNSNKYCYAKGDLKDYDGYAGMMCLSAHRKLESGRPLVLDGQKAPLTEKDGKPYAGCYVNATVEIYAQKGENAGIRCGLLAVQFARDGDAFSAGSKPNADDFDDIAEGATADDLV